MALYLVRHASAGVAQRDREDDHLRPLDDKGRAQARAIAERLSDLGITGLHSSPYLRCVQTLEPLADLLGLPIAVHAELGELSSGNPERPWGAIEAMELCASLAEGSVVCSHGDVIPAVIEALMRRGMEVSGPIGFRKASIWVIRRSPEGDCVTATWWDRPRVTTGRD